MGSGTIGRKFKPKMSAVGGQNQNSGTIGPKSCAPNPPLSASHDAQRGVVATTFRPNGPTVLVLAPHGAHFWFKLAPNGTTVLGRKVGLGGYHDWTIKALLYNILFAASLFGKVLEKIKFIHYPIKPILSDQL